MLKKLTSYYFNSILQAFPEAAKLICTKSLYTYLKIVKKNCF